MVPQYMTKEICDYNISKVKELIAKANLPKSMKLKFHKELNYIERFFLLDYYLGYVDTCNDIDTLNKAHFAIVNWQTDRFYSASSFIKMLVLLELLGKENFVISEQYQTLLDEVFLDYFKELYHYGGDNQFWAMRQFISEIYSRLTVKASQLGAMFGLLPPTEFKCYV